MVGAANQLAAIGLFVDQLQVAMPANVMEGDDAPLAIAQQEQRQSRDLDRLYVAGARQLVRKADKHPVVVEQVLVFELQEGIAGISLARQSVSNRIGSVEVTQQCGIQHDQTSPRRSSIYHIACQKQ